ncbi:pyridoxamine 5'-phosphate oxidase family protein [Streptomyces sp. ALB3]|uniref:pyridoxamine 5'-phosphate oxidase family protein n=1 Tax=Streptomyces sp. ALB3 TaxID=3374278 RepID=UPI0037A3F29B
MLSPRPPDTGVVAAPSRSDAGAPAAPLRTDAGALTPSRPTDAAGVVTACGTFGPAGSGEPPRSSAADRLRAVELLGSVRYGRLAMSMRALPFLAVARHLVVEGGVLLRMHKGFGFHEACDGSVVAYGADNFGSSRPGDAGDCWSVQFTGPVQIVQPVPEQRERFGTGPDEVNGEHFDPVYLRLDPHLAYMHTLTFDASP